MVSPHASGGVDLAPRPEIELSWKRSRLSGIAPQVERIELPVTEFDPGSHLMHAASPVLAGMAQRLAGTAYSLLLADRDCRLVHRWFDDPTFESAMSALGLNEGASLAEDQVGTNALGTAVETRRGIAVHGAEHYLEVLKGFTCYGHPIRHPVTRRLEGVLDITGMQSAVNPLLAPFLVRAVEDIEQRLLDQAKASERALLAAFQTVAQQRHGVVALGDDIVLSNRSALDLLGPDDYAVLRMLMDDLERAAERTTMVTLSSGTTVRAHLARIAGAGGGTIFRMERIGRLTVGVAGAAPGAAPARDPGRRTSADTRVETGTGPVLVTGQRGTGRTTEARRLAREDEVEFRNCADAVVDGETAWGRALRERLSRPGATVCLDNVELLPDALVAVVADAVHAGTGPRLVLTSVPVTELREAHRALAALCLDRVELAPLRDRGAEIAGIAARLLREIDPAADVRLVPGVIEVLASRPWPGNLHELRSVLAHVLRHRHAGDVTVADLPEAYRLTARRRQLAGRERAESEAILAALREHGGNKLQAARALGISRTTLYARMKALRIVL